MSCTEKQETSIDQLSIDLLGKIFSYIGGVSNKLRLEIVCKKWREASWKSPLAWSNVKKLDLVDAYFIRTNFRDDLPENDAFGAFVRCEMFISYLLVRCGTHLKSLTFGNDCMSMFMFPYIQQHCQNLVHLELGFDSYEDDDIQDKTLFSGLTNLKSFEIKKFPLKCGGLFQFYTDPKILLTLTDDIEEISFSSQLRCELKATKAFKTKFAKWHALRSLKLGLWNISAEMMNLVTTKSSLTFLGLAWSLVPKPVILNIVKLENLQGLDLSNTLGVHDMLIAKIIKKFKQLKHLNLNQDMDEDSTGISDRTLVKLGELKNLEFLGLKNLENVNDQVILSIVKNCKMLKHIDLSECYYVSQRALNELGKLDHLDELILNRLSNVNDETFNHFKNLKVLECDECSNLGDEGVMKVLQTSPGLEKLNIHGTGITLPLLYKICDIKKSWNNPDTVLIVITDLKKLDKFDDDHGIPVGLMIAPGKDHKYDDDEDEEDQDEEEEESMAEEEEEKESQDETPMDI